MLFNFPSETSHRCEDQYPYLLKRLRHQGLKRGRNQLVTPGPSQIQSPLHILLFTARPQNALKREGKGQQHLSAPADDFPLVLENLWLAVKKSKSIPGKPSSVAPVLTQILTSDSVEVKVNAEIITRISKVWDRDAIRTVDDTSFVIIL